MISVAVIGMGGIGNRHAQCYQENPLAQLSAVCDQNESRADAASERYGVPAYYSVQELFDKAEVAAVSVTTAGRENGGDHYAPVMQALEAGKDALCEKPISNDIALAREMVASAREKNLRFGINLNHRFVPFAWKAKEWVQEGGGGPVGHPLFINMALRIENPNESSPFFHFRALHPHSLDVMRFFAGEAAAVHAFANRAPGRINWSNLSMNIQYESGAVGHLSGSYDAGGLIERVEMGGTNGRFIIEGVFEELHYRPRRGGEAQMWTNPAPGEEGHVNGFNATFTNRIGHWLQQLTDGVPPDEIEASGEDGLRVQEIIEAGIRSFQKREVVEL